jgi:hypothetical protein
MILNRKGAKKRKVRKDSIGAGHEGLRQIALPGYRPTIRFFANFASLCAFVIRTSITRQHI